MVNVPSVWLMTVRITGPPAEETDPAAPGRVPAVIRMSRYLRSHLAWTRSDTLFDVPPSGGRLKTVIFTVRSP
jgi:hypothetical protein